MKSAALSSLGRPRDAFAALNAHKNQFWHDKNFLLGYLEAAYASGEEAAAGDALRELNALREQGKIDPREFRVATLDEILEVTKGHQERRRNALTAIARGQLPWTICGEVLRRPLVLEWMSRTQALRWLAEDSMTRAEFSVYATNGFAIETFEGDRQVTQIDAADRNLDICADYSALITLYSLGCMQLLFSTYGSVHIPTEYRLSILQDTKRLQPHQLSQRAGLEVLDELIAGDQVRIYSESDKDIARVDEYSHVTGGKVSHGLRALVDGLQAAGQLDKSVEESMRAIQRETGLESTSAQLAKGERIGVSLPTLLTLYRAKLLDRVISAFRVHISQADKQELERDLRSFRTYDSARAKLRGLWDLIEAQQNVKFVPYESETTQDESRDSGLSLLAMELAQRRVLPLLADDRSLQAVVTNSRGTAKGVAFGTDAFLRARYEAGELSIEEYSKSLIQLMRWRYRFLIPSAEVLHYFASRYPDSNPGAELSFIAEYGHDCMRDPGLLGGLENSTPPTSMALRLLGWPL
jgi:hypothetical protein